MEANGNKWVIIRNTNTNQTKIILCIVNFSHFNN